MKLGPINILGMALLLVSMAAPSLYANVVISEELWNNGDIGTPQWGVDEGFVSIEHSDGVTDGYLNIQYDDNRGPGEAQAVVYVDAGEFFAGAWDDASGDGAWIEFDFWADENTPFDFELRFGDSEGDIWRYNLETDGLGSGWAEFSASLVYDESLWYYGSFGGGDQASFLDDLANIDWIGIYIYDDATGANNYGLDDFQLMVPEPAEYALAISALVVMWLSIRRRRKEAAVQAA